MMNEKDIEKAGLKEGDHVDLLIMMTELKGLHRFSLS
jgi:hypothetical protein